MRFRFIFIVGVVLLTSGFGFLNFGNSLEKDISEHEDTLNSIFVTYWKGAKISIRSLPITEDTKEINFSEIKKEQAQRLGLGPYLSNIYDWEFLLKNQPASIDPISFSEILAFSKEVYDMQDNIEQLDEDDYPAFMEVVAHGSRVTTGEILVYPKPWSNSYDHWGFALVMEAQPTFGSWKTYELDKVNIDDFSTTDLRVFTAMHKGFDNLRNQWFFLADQSFTHSINELNRGDISLNETTKFFAEAHLIDGFTVEEQLQLLLRGASYLMRGWARHQSDDADLMKQASADIEEALTDFNRLGIDNELVWLAESYVYIKNEEPNKAITSLDKLSNSRLMSKNEIALIEETKNHLQDRDPEKALNFLTDKVFMYKLGSSYAYSYAQEIRWANILKESEFGRKILKRFNDLEEAINKAKEFISLEELKRKVNL